MQCRHAAVELLNDIDQRPQQTENLPAMNSDFSRRDFLALMGAGLVTSTSAAQVQSGQRLYAYVGSWTNSIVTFAVAADSGKLTPTGAKVDVPKPVCIQFATL